MKMSESFVVMVIYAVSIFTANKLFSTFIQTFEGTELDLLRNMFHHLLFSPNTLWNLAHVIKKKKCPRSIINDCQILQTSIPEIDQSPTHLSISSVATL